MYVSYAYEFRRYKKLVKRCPGSDIPCCRSVFRLTLYFSTKGTVSAIKFRKRLTKFKITIALPKKFGSKGFITAIKFIKI